MRLFQQIKFQFANQQGLIQPSCFHESGRPATNNAEKRQHNLPSIEGGWFDNISASSDGNLTESVSRRSNGLFGKRLTKQRTLKMLVLSSIFVVLLHGLGLIWLSAEQTAPAQPNVMEITIIPVSAPKPKVAPPPPPPPASAKTKPLPKKKQPKPTLKKTPVVQEPAEFAPKQQVFDAQPVAQNTIATTTADVAPPTKIEPFIEADMNADYAENPKPDYPSLARSMGWQGTVTLKVQVSEEGLSAAVEIERGSGYEILDESAIEAIRQWRFTPARRGETPIASTVIVPVIFTLQDRNQS